MGLNIKQLYLFIFLIFLFLPEFSFGKKTDEVCNKERSISFSFYNERINVAYHDEMLVDLPIQTNEVAITDFYNQMEKTPYQTLLHRLQIYQAELQLNDWLFYELVRTTLQKISGLRSDVQQELSSWFLLSKAGYNTRLTYLENYVFVYVHSDENIFETPMIESNGKMFINLSSIHNNIDTKGALLNMLSFVPNENEKSFSFDLSQLPKFRPVEKFRNLNFQWRNKKFSLKIKFDLNLIHMMENYPIFSETKYIQTPLSALAAQSLLPQLQEIINHRTEKEALEIIAIFTRSAFQYKDDKDYFGKNKPMIGDEVFHYPYSDCEDRSALFYYLVKELLHLPMIVIAYDDHLTIGVATTHSIGNAIQHGKQKYYICDPTGPSNSEEIGKAPRGYESKNFEILDVQERFNK